MNQTPNNEPQKQALRAAMDRIMTSVGTMSNQINTLAELEANAVLAGSRSVTYQNQKDALITSCEAALVQVDLLHKQLCKL